MNSLKKAREAHRIMSNRVANDNAETITTWLDKVKTSLGVQQLPNWYKTRCPMEITGHAVLTDPITNYAPKPESLQSALKLLVCHGISLESEKSVRSASFTVEFISGLFKTKNEPLSDEQVTDYLVKAMKNWTIPSENDIPAGTKVKIMDFVKSFENDYKALETLRDVLVKVKTEVATDGFKSDTTTGRIILLIASAVTKGEIEFILMSALMALSKGGSGSRKFMENKMSTFKKFWSYDISLREGIEQETQNEIFQFMEHRISNGSLDIELFISHVSTMLELSENVAVTPLLNQISLGKMTALHAISSALTQFSDFPWGPLAARSIVLKNELLKFKNYANILDGDRYAGLKFAGVGRLLPNLAYLSIQLLIKVGGQDSYENYKGVGSSSNKTGVNTKYFDKPIKDYMESTANLDMNELMQENAKYTDFLGKLGMETSIRKLLDGSVDEDEENNDESKKDEWAVFDVPDESDDDDSPPGPPPPRRDTKRKRSDDDDDIDRPTVPKKQQSRPPKPPSPQSGPSTSQAPPANLDGEEDGDEDMQIGDDVPPATQGQLEETNDRAVKVWKGNRHFEASVVDQSLETEPLIQVKTKEEAMDIMRVHLLKPSPALELIGPPYPVYHSCDYFVILAIGYDDDQLIHVEPAPISGKFYKKDISALVTPNIRHLETTVKNSIMEKMKSHELPLYVLHSHPGYTIKKV